MIQLLIPLIAAIITNFPEELKALEDFIGVIKGAPAPPGPATPEVTAAMATLLKKLETPVIK